MIFLQWMDWREGEDPRETELDLAEYALGLLIGKVV